ncbi:PE-PGRS family protein [Sorangium cellulosum So ce56]|uniref:PE-PGRS family protein n=2 Tax=Sorangium cellulosum TaxID=56 RepID=A9FZF3_SORC5|nr:PE-PGRS family protein [Sorangium cellulosum So ce56]
MNGQGIGGIEGAMHTRSTQIVAVSFVALLGCSDAGGGNLGGGGAAPGTTTGAEGGSGGGGGGSGGESSTPGSGGHGGAGGSGGESAMSGTGGAGGSGGESATSGTGGAGGSGGESATSGTGGAGGSGGESATSGTGGAGGSGGESATSGTGGAGGSGGESSASGTGGAGGSGGESATSGTGGAGGSGGESSTSGTGGAGGSGGESSTSGTGGAGGEGGSAAFGPCGTAGTSFGPPGAFLDLGHQKGLSRLFVSGSRVLSWDYDRWMLWDTDSSAAIADGHAPGGFDPGSPNLGILPFELPGGVVLRGDIVLIQTDPEHAFELRSAIDGSVLASVTTEYDQAGLASDGSYAWTRRQSTRTITLWSTAGVERWSAAVNHQGDVHAAPDALRIAPLPPVPLQNSIAVLPADGSPPTVTPELSGTFHSWFQDGERFLTTVGTTVRVYSKAGIQEGIVNLPSTKQLAGTRDYFWMLADNRADSPLMVYRVGGGAVPVAEYPDRADYRYTFAPTERALALLRKQTSRLDIIDLDGPEVTLTEHAPPLVENASVHIDQDLRLAVSNVYGAISYKGTLTDPGGSGLLGCGTLHSVAGAPSGHVALATGSGKTLVYDTAALDAGPSAVVPFHSNKVLLSADGGLLAARAALDPMVTDKSLRLFSLPDGAQLASLLREEVIQDFSMSFDGSTVGRTYRVDSSRTERVVSDWAGSAPLFQDTGHRPAPLVSPDGHHVVVTDSAPSEGCGFTQLYEDGALVNVVPGCAIGWLDDTHVLVQSYNRFPQSSRWTYQASTIYDELGNPVAAPPLPRIPIRTDSTDVRDNYGIQPVSATALYSRYDGVLYDIETGAALATFPGLRSAVAGAFMVHPCGYGVCAETY